MKVKVKKSPKMGYGGPINNIANPIPYPSLFNINPFGLIAANPTGTSDDSITTSLQPVDRDKANIEAEKGEMLVKGDMSGLYKIKGKKHSEGGTPLFAKGGSFIFSDNKELSFSKEEKDAFNFKKAHQTKRNNTPAKVLQREVDPEHYNKMMTILQDPKSPDIAKQTAALMLQKHQEKIGQVALLQEAKKTRASIPPFAQGPTGLSTEQHDRADQITEKMYAAMGGYVPLSNLPQIPGYYAYGGDTDADDPNGPPDKTGKWAGDSRASRNPLTKKISSDWNAMRHYQSPQDYAGAIGYTGNLDPQNPASIQKMQQWVMKQYPGIVKMYHAPDMYGMPTSGRPDDGKLGVRWDAIGQEIEDKTPKYKPNVPLSPINPSTPPGPITAAPIAPPTQRGPAVTQDQWQGFHFGMNGAEALTTIAPFMTALSQKPYYDMLIQRNSPNIRLDRMDATQEAANIQQQSSLAQREAAGILPGRMAVANASATQARTTGALDNLYHQTNERNQQIANQESEFNLQNKLRDMDFNLGQIQQTYRNNVLTNQRRDEQIANGATASINNGVAIRQRLDAMGSAATQAALPFVTGQKDANGNPVYTRDAQGNAHQQMGVPIGFGANRNPVYNPNFGGTDSVGINQMGQSMVSRNFNSMLMGQVTDALNDKSPEGTKRLYTLLLGLDRTNRPNTKGDTPLEEIGQAARSAYYGQ